MKSRVRDRRMAVGTGLLVPLLLVAGLLSSGAKGGFGIRLGRTLFEVHQTTEAHFDPRPDAPVFVLVVGNDARPGDVEARGDALHLIGINPAAGKGTILDFPRDLYVPLPGRGTDKINAAFNGGPVAQAKALSQLVGVDIPYVITTGFDGFQQMVDELGGVDVDVPNDMVDPLSGADFRPGPNHMLGGEALAFSRDRHLDGGDLTRTNNQGRLILAGLAKLRGEGVTVANTIRWLGVLLRNSQLDGVSVPDLYRLGRLALSIDPANMRNVTVPGIVGTAGTASVVFPAPEDAALYADFRDNAVLDSF